MNVTKLSGKGNDLLLEVVGITFAQANTLRRLMMNEVPVMAVEAIEFKQNASVLYDEMLALRIGLLPLTTDLKSYNVPAECTCKGAGCAKCQVQLTLSAKGPCIVYAKDFKSKDPKIKPVFPETPIIKLLEGHEIELVATAQLGFGQEHAKWATGLIHYHQKPKLVISKEADAKAVMKTIKSLGLDAISEKSGKLVVDEKKLAMAPTPEAYEDISRDIIVEYVDDTFIFSIESWGQLSPQEIIDAALERLQTYLKELSKLVKEVQ